MPYIGTSPSNAIRRRFIYEATASQTSFSGSDENGVTLTYVDSLYLDVYQNGVKLKAGDDYTATTGTTVVLAVGASANDVVEMIAFDVFSVNDSVSASAGGNFGGNVAMAGTLGVTGVPTFTGRSVHSGGITVANGGQIGSVGDADAISIASNGVVTFSQTPVGDNAGKIIQIVNVQTGAVATGNTNTVNDDTIPQKTEGTEFMTLAVTPTNASNKLLIEVIAQLSDDGGDRTQMSLYQDSTANALASNNQFNSAGNATSNVAMRHFMTAGTTSETTFKVRAGGINGITTFNGEGGARKLGGVYASSITITEISA